jgi:signal transduction histidine kinase
MIFCIFSNLVSNQIQLWFFQSDFLLFKVDIKNALIVLLLFVILILLFYIIKFSKKNSSKALEKAETSNHAKSDFLASMSHEIRTPLNAIIGFSKLLQETNLNNKQQQFSKTITQSASILLEVVNDILDFSKIETGKFELDPQKSDLSELSNQVLDIIRFESIQKNIALNLFIHQNVPNFVALDALRIKQILLNLLANAVKFTHIGKVEFHITATSKNDEKVFLKFSVKDSGVGIKPENQSKIFEAFSQEDQSTSRKFGGSGLGLSISNKILGLMNSKLQLKSELGKGSEFYFEIEVPYFNENQIDTIDVNLLFVDFEDVTETLKSSVFNKPKKILVVEDNSINMLLARTLIKKTMPKAIIFEALDGDLGLVEFAKCEPDIILLDIQMPILNGYETAVEIRKINKKIPIIALTAGIIKGEKEKCIESGMNDYMSKPIDAQVFENMLLKWLK